VIHCHPCLAGHTPGSDRSELASLPWANRVLSDIGLVKLDVPRLERVVSPPQIRAQAAAPPGQRAVRSCCRSPPGGTSAARRRALGSCRMTLHPPPASGPHKRSLPAWMVARTGRAVASRLSPPRADALRRLGRDYRDLALGRVREHRCRPMRARRTPISRLPHQGSVTGIQISTEPGSSLQRYAALGQELGRSMRQPPPPTASMSTCLSS
jgi:hypothetical protein